MYISKPLLRNYYLQQALANISDKSHYKSYCIITLLEFAQVCYQKHGPGVVVSSNGKIFYRNRLFGDFERGLDSLVGDHIQEFLLATYLGDLCVTELISAGSEESRWKCLLPISWQTCPNDYLLS